MHKGDDGFACVVRLIREREISWKRSIHVTLVLLHAVRRRLWDMSSRELNRLTLGYVQILKSKLVAGSWLAASQRRAKTAGPVEWLQGW